MDAEKPHDEGQKSGTIKQQNVFFARYLAMALYREGAQVKSYIALIRGINVGGRNSLPMKELVALFKSLGYQNVQTYIQSGNVVFQSPKSLGASDSGGIAKAILDMKGFEPRVMLVNAEILQRAIEENPFPIDNPKALHFFFLGSQAEEPNLDRLMSLKTESERFELGRFGFYLYTPDGLGRSKLASAVEKALGVAVTARNWNTVNKLASMLK